MKLHKFLKNKEELTIGEFYKRVFGESGTPQDYKSFCVKCELDKNLKVRYQEVKRGASIWLCYTVRKK